MILFQDFLQVSNTLSQRLWPSDMKNDHTLLGNINSRCPLPASSFAGLFHHSLAACISFYQLSFTAQTQLLHLTEPLPHGSAGPAAGEPRFLAEWCCHHGGVARGRRVWDRSSLLLPKQRIFLMTWEGQKVMTPVAGWSSEWSEVSWKPLSSFPVCHFLWEHPGQIHTCHISYWHFQINFPQQSLEWLFSSHIYTLNSPVAHSLLSGLLRFTWLKPATVKMCKIKPISSKGD